MLTDDKGVDRWIYRGRPQGISELNAVVSGRPRNGSRDRPASPRCVGHYDVHERVRDMNRNRDPRVDVLPDYGVLGAPPQHAPGRSHAGDGVGLQRLAHRRVGRLVPRPSSSRSRSCRPGTQRPCAPRSAARRRKGCRAVTMPELPHLEGLSSYDEDYWGPVFRTLSERTS